MEATSSRNRPRKHTVKEELEQRIRDVESHRCGKSQMWTEQDNAYLWTGEVGSYRHYPHGSSVFSGLIRKSRMLPLFFS
jgi:hypothetical protein